MHPSGVGCWVVVDKHVVLLLYACLHRIEEASGAAAEVECSALIHPPLPRHTTAGSLSWEACSAAPNASILLLPLRDCSSETVMVMFAQHSWIQPRSKGLTG